MTPATLLTIQIIFWLCALCVGYTYVGYPLCLAVWARLRPKAVRRGPYEGSVSVIVAVRNEAATISRRIGELIQHLDRAKVRGELIIVSDGSTDRTVEILSGHEDQVRVHVIELVQHVGKAGALTVACQHATGDVLVFADARQTWAEDALERLLENFADPTVGAVSGDLVLESTHGMLAGVGFYWRFEKWLRRQESRVHSQVGVTGAISAVRRTLFRPIPAGTLLDDVYWPLRVALEGSRVVHDARARAYDRLPARSRDEFRRKVRTLAGNYQLAGLLPGALVPWRNPIWWPWVSHKLMRLAVPWALLAMLATSWLLPAVIYQAAFRGQLACYAIGITGLVPAVGRHLRVIGAAGSFLVLNTAAWLGFWVWVLGRADRSWGKVNYEPCEAAPAPATASVAKASAPARVSALSARD